MAERPPPPEYPPDPGPGPSPGSDPGLNPVPARIPIIHTDIILADFVGFSTLDDNGQYIAMSVVSRFMGTVLEKLSRDSFGGTMNMVIGWVPTGDGFYIILNPLACGTGIFTALALRHVLMTRINQTVGFKGVRVAVHHGSAIPFDDVTGKRNYIGTGLNDCARLLSLKPEEVVRAKNFHRDDNMVVASEAAVDFFFTAYPRDQVQHFLDIGGWRQSAKQISIDKHGKHHPYYFIDTHRDATIGIPRIMNPIPPRNASI